jgi:hypothetical protein
MRIVKLQSENVKRIKAVSIEPTGSMVTLKGKNRQGKTSILDSIQLALGGKGAHPPKVIRDGETSAKVVLELDDLIVERRWTGNDKSTLEVRSKEGAKFPSPQSMLDKLVGSLSFDPLAFMRYEPAKQLALLRTLTGIDTSDLDAEHKRIYDERTVVNRELDRARAALPPVVEAPAAEVSPAALLAEQERMQEQIAANFRVRDAVKDATSAEQRAYAAVEEQEGSVAALAERLAQATQTLESMRTKAGAATKARAAAEHAAAALEPDPDLSAIRAKMATVEAENALVRQKANRDRLVAEGKAKKAEADALTAKLQEIVAARETRIASAKFPVKGLGFGSDGITYGGLPFEQASSAEQLQVSLAMGLALNPKLKVLLIRDGSLLDEDSMATVAAMAEQHGAQVWVEVVGKGGTGILIEDGQVADESAVEAAAQ